jgi:hypothetical protein
MTTTTAPIKITLTAAATTITAPAANSVVEFSTALTTAPTITIPVAACNTQLFLVNLSKVAINIANTSGTGLVFSLAATSAASAFCDGYCWFVGGSLSGTVATPLPVPTPTPTPTPTNPTPSSYPKLVGTNMGGGDMDWQSLPPVSEPIIYSLIHKILPMH